jgi:RNA-binding protein YlmH
MPFNRVDMCHISFHLLQSQVAVVMLHAASQVLIGAVWLSLLVMLGFRMSRAKMTDLIKGGDVRVNWRPAGKASSEVKQGDVVSVSGRGRLEVKDVSISKKGKFVVNMVRYV